MGGGLMFVMLGMFAQEGLPSAQADVSTSVVQVGTPTYFADGQVRGATAGIRPGPSTLYLTSGRTLCESRSAVGEPPADTGYGWRLHIQSHEPMRYTSARGATLSPTFVTMRVTWQRMWERGQRVTDGEQGSATVTLHPGESILLDHLKSQETTPGCPALGMGLEIGLPRPNAGAVYESDLWLVQQVAGGPERSQQQTFRVRDAAAGEFFFDAIPLIDRTVIVLGRVSPSARPDGKVHVRLDITRSSKNAQGQSSSGGTTYEFDADDGQTVRFELPEGPTSPRLSLMIRVKRLP